MKDILISLAGLVIGVAAAGTVLWLISGPPRESYATRDGDQTHLELSASSHHNAVDIQTIEVNGHLFVVARAGSAGVSICEVTEASQVK